MLCTSARAWLTVPVLALVLSCGGGRRTTPSGPGSDQPRRCAPTTCAAEQKSCGTITDGCSGTLDCGQCGAGQSCGGDGVANVCGNGSCTPMTCADVGATCGAVSDGCAAVLDCGVCTAPQTCGGGGVANQCGRTCTPATCANRNATCGMIDDGCGQSLDCGTCTAPDSCGGGGIANRCGQGCTPASCTDRNANCGMVDDGCGNMILCGRCTSPETCGGGGTANQCGRNCQPTTCQDQSAECGDISDGCGATLACGVCSGALTCGGAGQANRCGAMCAMTCPPGYSCDNEGVCSGGTSTTLALDVRTHRVAGVVTMNGAPPTSSCGSVDRAYVDFFEPTLGYNHTIIVPCNGATSPFTFDGFIYPGSYTVKVRGRSSTLPAEAYTVQTGLLVQSDLTTLSFDVRTHRVAGVVTMNGSMPTSSCGSVDRAYVDFVETTLGYNHTITVPCNGATSPFAFDGFVYPGTYTVRVRGRSSTLPAEAFTVQTGLNVQSNLTTLSFDVRTHRVAGVVTMNGTMPTSSCGSVDRAYVDFVEPTLGYNHAIIVPCNGASSPFAFDGFVYPGQYTVKIRGRSSTLPAESFIVQTGLNVQSNLTTLAFDARTHRVAGVVTMNGAIPMSSCGSVDRAYVDFVEPTLGYNHALIVPCDGATSPFAFDGFVYPGTYTVRIRGRSSTIPSEPFTVQTGLTVQSNLTTLSLDVRTHRVSGIVTMNGVQPMSSCGSVDRAYVDFIEPSLGHSHALIVPCDGATSPFSFDGFVYPGTYTVRVRGRSSTIPSEPYTVQLSLSILANATTLSFDVRTHRVSGVVTMNSQQPMSSCGSVDRAYVDFVEPTIGHSHALTVPCNGANSPFSFDGFVYPGVYTVKVRGRSSTLPSEPYVVIERLRVP